MSDRINNKIVDFPAFLSVIDRVRCVLFRSFLVRKLVRHVIVVGRVLVDNSDASVLDELGSTLL
jgi:hypothetical protein